MKRKFHKLWGISRLKLNWCEHQLNKVLHKMPTCKRKLHHQKKQKFMSLLTRRLKNTGYENIRGIFLLTYIANGEKKIRVHILMNSTADCRKMMQFYLKFQISCCKIVWKWKGPPNVTLLPILKKSIHLGPKSATTFYLYQYLVISQNALKTETDARKKITEIKLCVKQKVRFQSNWMKALWANTEDPASCSWMNMKHD